jgi:transposase
MTDHTTVPKISRLEVIATGSRRRWSAEEKHRIVAEALSAPRNVSATARRHALSPGQLFTWCRLARVGKLSASADLGFAPVLIGPEAGAFSGSRAMTGVMEIALANGRRVRIDASVDVAALGRVIDVLERR